MTTRLLAQFQDLLATPKKCVVIPHKNPDGDALGSCLAWANFLSAKGHEVAVVSPNEYPAFLNWLPGQETIVKYSVSPDHALQHIAETRVIFTFDFTDLKRIHRLKPPMAAAAAPKGGPDRRRARRWPEDCFPARILGPVPAGPETTAHRETTPLLPPGFAPCRGFCWTSGRCHRLLARPSAT